jgi:hypothetical protein
MKFGMTLAAVALLAACAVSTSVLAYGQQSLPPTNQIMFEGVGSGTFNSHQMNFNFSVRCYGSSCVGAFVFAKPGKSVVNYVTGTVTQPQPNMYMMSLSTRPSPTAVPPSETVSCSLVNTPPVTQGETNTVTMSCSSPAGSGSSQNAVVLAPEL